jgi:hypothetical protein
MYAGLASVAMGLGALAYVGLVDPHRPGSVFPPCPFKMLTGWDCPACGGLRMTNDLLHGNLPAAVADNVVLLAGLPLLAIWSLWQIRRGRRVLTPAFLVVVVVAATVWTVVRNLPGFPLVPTMLGP